MSIMTHQARKSSRPATIRPTPATFGVGIFEPVADVAPIVEAGDDWGARFDAAQRRYRESLRKPTATAAATPAVACEECETDAGDVEGDPSTWPAWTDEDVWTTTEEPSFADELVEAVRTVSTRRGPSVDPVDYAWYNGFTLGESGYEVHQVAPPSSYTPAERTAFVEGLASGSAERWADYEKHLERMEALDRMSGIVDIHHGEYMEARMIPC